MRGRGRDGIDRYLICTFIAVFAAYLCDLWYILIREEISNDSIIYQGRDIVSNQSRPR